MIKKIIKWFTLRKKFKKIMKANHILLDVYNDLEAEQSELDNNNIDELQKSLNGILKATREFTKSQYRSVMDDLSKRSVNTVKEMKEIL